jgi:hypothetical protein
MAGRSLDDIRAEVREATGQDGIDIPLFPLVSREYTYVGSFWGTTTTCARSSRSPSTGKIQRAIHTVRFGDASTRRKEPECPMRHRT